MRQLALLLTATALALGARAAPALLRTPDPNPSREDLKRVQGKWEQVGGDSVLVVRRDRWTFWADKARRFHWHWRCSLDAGRRPKRLDLCGVGEEAGLRILAVYCLKGDALTLCCNRGEGARPARLTPADDSRHERSTFRRVSKP
jgi:uncharacterized protein (TIGR03067 family)